MPRLLTMPRFIATISSVLLAACAGGLSAPLPRAGDPNLLNMFAPGSATMTVTPSKLSLNGEDGAYSYEFGGATYVVVAEPGYKGTFSADLSTCNGVVTLNPPNGSSVLGRGPNLNVPVYGLAPGSCTMTFSDTEK